MWKKLIDIFYLILFDFCAFCLALAVLSYIIIRFKKLKIQLMNIKALVYSLDEDIKISNLKKDEFSTDYDFTNLEKRADANAVQAMIQDENTYHHKFSIIKSSPYIIYYKWDINILNLPVISIVWPRKHSEYATQVLEQLFESLKSYNIATCSGMAQWVDELVHKLSIANNIPTIAVLGWGLAYYMNSQRRGLISKIVDAWWLVLSEFKLKSKPAPYTFPQRNRIIAWLANTVFLPEAGEGSGSLITADFALDMHKPVFGVSSGIFDMTSKWLNQYIQDGKIKSVSDLPQFVDQQFWAQKKDNTKTSNQVEAIPEIKLNPEQTKVVKILSAENSCSLQYLVDSTNIDPAGMMWILSDLEIDGIIYQTSPGMYAIKTTLK